MFDRRTRDLNVIISALLFAAALPLTACTSPPRPRNVLIVSLDTMRADRLPAYGFTGVSTPVLDSLAAEGALFDEAFTAVPLTLPSHATIFTGSYPARLNVRDNAGLPLAPAFVTLAETMRDHGRRTGAFVASAVLAPERGLDQGFQHYSLGPIESCRGDRARRSADAVTNEALAWLAQDSAPFFAWIHFYDAHRPYQLPGATATGFADPYLAAIAFEDAQLGRIIEYLKASRALDDTLVVVLGDHGESLGDHGEDSHGIFVYQETLRVPLILRGPGIAPRRIPNAVRLVDLMPTVLEMSGWQVPALDGLSFTPLLQGEHEVHSREIYAESLYPERFGWASLRSLRTDRYKVIDAPRPELYDLDEDPTEQRNLASARPSTTAAMLERLRHLTSESTPRHLSPLSGDRFAELASLGYISRGSDVTAPSAIGTDPKDEIEQFNRFTMHQAAVGAAGAAHCGQAGRLR
jgi:choline-sulfatase